MTKLSVYKHLTTLLQTCMTSEANASTTPATDTAYDVRRILVPVDFTPASLHAIRQGAGMATKLGSSVCLLHVVDCGVFNQVNQPALEKTSEDVMQEAEQQLRALADAELQQSPHEVKVAVGSPVEEILKAADTGGCDLIIMAQHEYNAVDRVLHRHTLRGVESGAHCQVLTLHCDEAGEIEPKLWKGSAKSRVGEWVGKVFLRAFGTPND
jgi:nucleotide-binding universal stress UspA family protein